MYYIEIDGNKITGKGSNTLERFQTRAVLINDQNVEEVIALFDLAENQREITKDLYDQLTRLPATFEEDEEGNIINIVNAPNPPEFATTADVDNKVVVMIRLRYSESEENKLKRLAINALINQEPIPAIYLDYNEHVENCRIWGKLKKIELGLEAENGAKNN